MDCLECGKIFFGTNMDFCSMECFKKNTADSKSVNNDSNTEQKDDDPK